MSDITPYMEYISPCIEKMPISEIISYIKLGVGALKKLGSTADEIKVMIKQVGFSTEDENTLSQLIDVFYADAHEQDALNFFMAIGWIGMIELFTSVYRAVMIETEIELKKRQMAYIGKNGRDYQSQEGLMGANNYYALQMHR